MKKLTLTQTQYNEVKEIVNTNCFAKAYDIITELYKVEREVSRKIASAVYYNYKYLNIVEG